MQKYLSTKQVCQLIGCYLSFFYRYFFTPGGHRRFSIFHIRKVFNLSNFSSKFIAYSRVSSHDQKKDLIAQEAKLVNFAQSLPNFNYHNFISITDLGFGLNYKKKGLKNLLSLIFNQKVHTLILNHKDRH